MDRDELRWSAVAIAPPVDAMPRRFYGGQMLNGGENTPGRRKMKRGVKARRRSNRNGAPRRPAFQKETGRQGAPGFQKKRGAEAPRLFSNRRWMANYFSSVCVVITMPPASTCTSPLIDLMRSACWRMVSNCALARSAAAWAL